MSFASWMECDLGHMWPVEEDVLCPVCSSPGWRRDERTNNVVHLERATVIKRVVDLESEIRTLRRVVAEQAHHHRAEHPQCPGLPDASAAAL